ncbi:MAG: sigma-70 family RNA polymerase sigma factor [Kineosporiaceae bacterium]|nr:sigma-70 family RNA polymerase sigma factor [Aeromicrobium sp.]
MAHAIAHRYRDRGELVEDLEQVACLGLVKAVHGFDPSRELDFLVYAVPTILGEVKRHFRDRCWVVRPTRRIQELKSQIAGCTEMLRQTLGHAPCAAEIADYLGKTLDAVNEALSADSCFLPVSLDIRVGESGGSSRGELIGETDPDFDRAEIRSLLRPCLDKLSAQDRQMVAHRFVDQWTQEQIAQDLGVSQMQISRRLSRIMLTLRKELGEDVLSA